MLLIFSSSGDSAVFSAAFEADSLAAAEVLLLELGEAELRERLASADAWAGGRD